MEITIWSMLSFIFELGKITPSVYPCCTISALLGYDPDFRIIGSNKRFNFISMIYYGCACHNKTKKQPSWLPILPGECSGCRRPTCENRQPHSFFPNGLAKYLANYDSQYESKEEKPHESQLNQDRNKGVMSDLILDIDRTIHIASDTHKRMFFKGNNALCPQLSAPVQVATGNFIAGCTQTLDGFLRDKG